MGILPLKKRVNRDKCSFTTKQRMFGVFAIDEILCYRWTRFAGSRTLCHPAFRCRQNGQQCMAIFLVYSSIPNSLEKEREFTWVLRICKMAVAPPWYSCVSTWYSSLVSILRPANRQCGYLQKVKVNNWQSSEYLEKVKVEQLTKLWISWESESGILTILPPGELRRRLSLDIDPPHCHTIHLARSHYTPCIRYGLVI